MKTFVMTPISVASFWYFFVQNVPVAPLCHAPLAPAAAGVLSGRTLAGDPALARYRPSGRRCRGSLSA
ncbi:MAG: hypothetical protein M1294_06245 [Firmicutes bacterium]|nr:hypothetical protein [Bacillota bacterium]